MHHCIFCKLLDTRENTRFYNEVLYETKNFVVLPALGQFVEGYLLIVAKKHIPNMGGLSHDDLDELINVKAKITSLLETLYESPLYFEHGSFCNLLKSGNSVHHAHIHAIGKDISILKEIEEHISLNKIRNMRDLKEYHINQESYIYYEEKGHDKYCQKVDIEFPSQFLRRVLAEKLGLKESWDWKLYPHYEKIENTIKEIKITGSNILYK